MPINPAVTLVPPVHAPTDEVTSHYGEVLTRVGSGFEVRCSSRTVQAKRASGCLLEPAPGDVVLMVASDDRDAAYITMVLEHAGAAETQLCFEGDVAIRTTGGSLRLEADEGITLSTSRDLTTLADKVSLRGRTIDVCFSGAKLMLKTLDSALESATQRIRRSYRVIEEADVLRAGTLDHRAEGAARLHGETTFVTATGLAKVDGAQIHMG